MALTEFEGREVDRCAIEIPGAAGGLRDALKFDPIEVGIDEERVLVMKVRCKKVRFDEVKDEDSLCRVHVFEPVGDFTAFIDESRVKKELQAQADKVQKARDEAEGILRLKLEQESEDAEQAAREAGD